MEFNTETLKGKISLNDYMQFMFGVYEQNKRIENKLDIVIGEFAKLKVSESAEEEENEGSEDFFMGMIKNVMNTDPEVKKAFGSFLDGDK